MIGKTAEQMWGAAQLMLNPECMIDKFLDWVEELSCAMVPAHVEGLVPIEEWRDPFNA